MRELETVPAAGVRRSGGRVGLGFLSLSAALWIGAPLRTDAAGAPACPLPRQPQATVCACDEPDPSADFCPAHAWELLVQPNEDESSRGRIEAVFEKENVEVEYRPSIDVYVVAAKSRKQMAVIAKRVKPFALVVEANDGYRASQVPPPPALPDDADFRDQWSLHNDGSLSNAKPDVDINAPEAWSALGSSKEPVVGVVDSGVDLRSAELGGRVWRNKPEAAGTNGTDDDANGWPDDVFGINAVASGKKALGREGVDGSGHGTKVASIIAAETKNALAMAAVAPRARFIPCRASANDCATAANVAECVDYFADFRRHEVNVVAANISLEGDGCNCTLEKSIRAARETGLLVVASAGNGGTSNDASPKYPASYPISNVIAVAATNRTDGTGYNFGAHTVHLGAPGYRVIALERGQYPSVTTVDGTSFAAPHVTGVLALLSVQGVKDWRTLRSLVLAGGVPVKSLKDKTITGRRLRAWDASGTGALTCKGQQVQKRIWPFMNTCALDPKIRELELRVLSIDCGKPSPPIVEWKPKSSGKWTPLQLHDDQTAPDEIANDGEWSAIWKPPSGGKTYKFVVRDPASPKAAKDVLFVEVP